MIKIVLDTETTGLLKPSPAPLEQQPEIVELYACMIDDKFQLLAEYHCHFKPRIPIPEETTKIHGISNETVKDAPSFEDEFDHISKFFTGTDEMIAHNLSYDRSMLANECLRIDKILNFPWPRIHTCTVEMSMPIEQRRISLAKLHTYATGHPHSGEHSAKGDVMALIRCYHWMMESVNEDLFSKKGIIH